MKKLIIVIAALAAILVAGFLIFDKEDTGNSSGPQLKSYTRDKTSEPAEQDDVGGSGTDTKPSSDGSDADNNLMSQ